MNVTDGLDGLAAGSALFGFFAFTIIAFWGFRNPTIYSIVNPLDLAVLAVSFAAACAGFLWWNAAPARIFMGDVGALGLGAALALLGITTNTMLLLPIICGLQVTEILSVAAQMGSYRYFNHRRIFKMSPIHHHFELIGWPETTVIIRFWLISGIFVAVALGIYYADFARLIGVRDEAAARPRVRLGRRRRGHRPRAAGARRSTSPWPTTVRRPKRSTWPRELGIDLYEAPSMGKVERLVERADLVVPSPGIPEHHPLDRVGPAPRRAAAQRDRPGLRVGAGATGWRPADAGGHRHRRQDDDHAAGDGDAGRRRACRQWPPATPRRRW